MAKRTVVVIDAAELALLRREAADGRLMRLMLHDLYRRHGGPVPCTLQLEDILAAAASRHANLQGLLREENAGGNQETDQDREESRRGLS